VCNDQAQAGHGPASWVYSQQWQIAATNLVREERTGAVTRHLTGAKQSGEGATPGILVA
jgi:hypothetical protein